MSWRDETHYCHMQAQERYEGTAAYEALASHLHRVEEAETAAY